MNIVKRTTTCKTKAASLAVTILMGFNIVGCSFINDLMPGQQTEATVSSTPTLSTMSTAPVAQETEATTEPTTPASTLVFTDFVNLIYGELLGREATEEEINSTVPLLENSSISVNSIVLSIVESSEFSSKNYTDDEFLNICFRLFLRTVPDIQIQNYWINLMEANYTRSDIVKEFMAREEFSELCSGYGLLPDMGDINDITPSPREVVDQAPSNEYVTGLGGYIPSSDALNQINLAMDDLKSRGYKFGFIVIDMQSSRGICYNLDYDFYTASSIKAPFAVSLAMYNPDAAKNRENTIINMLVNSDNDAYTALNDSYRRTYIQQMCEDAGISPDPCVYKYPHLTSRQMAMLWIYSYYYFESDDFGQTVGSWLENPYYSLIHSELGETYTTRSKAGWVADDNPYHTTTVDAGVVYTGCGDYVIVIMSNVPSSIEPLRPLMQALNNAHDEM